MKKKINILIELNSFDRGGLEKVVLDSALRFDRKKFNVIILSIKKIGLLAEVATEHGIKVYTLERFKNPINKGLYLIYILLKNRIDVACSHFSHDAYWFYKILGISNITFIHNVYAFLDEKMIRKLHNLDKLIGAYISVSENATQYAVKKIGLGADKITTIPNGLIISEHEERLRNLKKINRSDFGLNENDYVFLNVASYNLHKGHYLMADAMMKILKDRKDIKILCIGNMIVDDHVKKFKEYLMANDLHENILMPGHCTNIEAFYDISDAFLLPSFIEGWSIAMNEAMFYQKPMILSNTGGSKQVIENNDIGILIDNEYGEITNLDCEILDRLAYETKNFLTSNLLISAMLDFANNKESWKEAGKKGRDKILNSYNFDNVVLKYEDVICKVANK